MKTLRVFTNDFGEFGNPVGIVVDPKQIISKKDRQKLAVESGYSEIIFVNNLENKEISIYTPKHEIPFAGHALVGTAYFLSQEYHQTITKLISIGGVIDTWTDNKLTWVRGSLAILPNWNYEQLDSHDLVENLTLPECTNKPHIFIWAWINQKKGLIRARTFAADWGIPEDEANGSGSMKLAVLLKQEITIIHGRGSVIHARPATNNRAEVGGMVSI